MTISAPITLAETWGGFATNRGVLQFDGSRLAIEFETTDGLLEVMRSGIRRVEVPVERIESIEWCPGWWGGQLQLATPELAVLQDVPGSSQGRVSFSVARRDRAAAARLANEVQLALAGRVLHQAAEITGRSPS